MHEQNNVTISKKALTGVLHIYVWYRPTKMRNLFLLSGA